MPFITTRGSIRKKILILVAIATLPVFTLLLIHEINNEHESIEAAVDDTKVFLHGFSEVQRSITASTRTLLQTVAAMPEVQRMEPKRTQVILGTLLKANPIYTNVILVDTHGNVVAMGKGKDKGFNFADRKQFKDAISTKQFSHGEYVVGKATRKSIFPFGMPVLDRDGNPVGVIIIGVNLSHYGEQFNRTKFPEKSFFGLTDHKGVRLFRSPIFDQTPIGKPVKADVFAAAKNAATPGTLETRTSDGYMHIIAYEPLRLSPESPPYMYMFIGLDKHLIVHKARQGFVQGIAVSAISLTITLLVAILLGYRSLVRGIEKLTEATIRFRHGEQDHASGIDYRDGEIGQLARSFDSMTETLLKREQDLQEAMDSAKTANCTKDEFLANMSHEIRTPLNGIMGMLQLLKTSKVDEEQLSFLNIALQSSTSLLRVLNDLLDFSKIEAGKLEIIEAPFELRDLMDECMDLFRIQADEKGLRLDYHIDDKLMPAYMGDVGRIRQILFNLIGNAIKFTREGHIHVEVYALPHPEQDRDRLFFSISDTGMGIPDDKLDHIFESFTQVDGSFTRRYQGTGLGLPIVKKLVGMMGGNCSVESELNVGTTVRFCVLVGIRLPDEPPLLAPAPASQPRSLNLLLVEDEKVNRIMATRLLERMGHKVTHVENGEQCLEALHDQQFDAILMDIQMPIMNGLEATKRIRTAEAFRPHANTPVIALSAHASATDRETALSAGMDEYVCKPFEKDELEQVLFQVIDSKS